MGGFALHALALLLGVGSVPAVGHFLLDNVAGLVIAIAALHHLLNCVFDLEGLQAMLVIRGLRPPPFWRHDLSGELGYLDHSEVVLILLVEGVDVLVEVGEF